MKWMLSVVTLLCGFVGGWFFSGGAPEVNSGEPGSNAVESTLGASAVDVAPRGSAGQLGEGAVAVSEGPGFSEQWLESLEGLNDFDRLGVIHARVKDLPAADFSKLIDELAVTQTTNSWHVRSMIATRWAEVDPQGLLVYLEAQTTQKQWGLASALFSSWGRTDPDAAMAAASRLSGRNLQMNAMNVIAQAMAKEDPLRAVAVLTQGDQVDLQRSSWVLRTVYAEWTRKDPAGAREAALALEDGQHKTQALTGVMSEWLAEDPLQALEWLDSLPVDSAVYRSHRQIFQELVNRDFERAQAYVEGKTNPLERRKVLEGLNFHNLAWQQDTTEIRALYDWVGTVATGQMYDNKISDLVRSLASVDPEGTREFALSLPAGNARLNALGAMAGELARSDPAAAIAFAQSLEYADERQRVLSNLGWQLTNSGVVDAARLVSESADPEVQQQLASRIGDQWSQFDPATSLEWATALVDENARLTATQAVLKNWAQADADAAFAYVSQVTEDLSRQAGVYESIFNDWARQDPEAAVQALDRLPEGEAFENSKSNIYRSIASTYVNHDPMAASEWIATLDAGLARDQSVQTLVNSISRSDPEAGFIWASTVEDTNTRTNSLNRSLREWAQEDPDAANRAIADADMPAEEKEGLFQVVENHRPKDS